MHRGASISHTQTALVSARVLEEGRAQTGGPLSPRTCSTSTSSTLRRTAHAQLVHAAVNCRRHFLDVVLLRRASVCHHLCAMTCPPCILAAHVCVPRSGTSRGAVSGLHKSAIILRQLPERLGRSDAQIACSTELISGEGLQRTRRDLIARNELQYMFHAGLAHI